MDVGKRSVTVGNIINRVKARTQGGVFPPNQEVTMNADGSGGPVSFNKDAKFGTSLYGGKSGGTTQRHKEIEKSDDRSGYDKFSDYGHMALDGLGMIPAFGAIADGVNAAWYSGEAATGLGPNSRADSAMYAGMSAAAMIPGAGQGVTATKYAAKGYDKLNKFGKFKKLLNPKELVKNVKMDLSDVAKNKSLKGFKPNKTDIGFGLLGVGNSALDISNTDYDKPKVQEDVSKLDNSPEAVLESERRGDEAINDPMSSGKTKSWSKGYSDYKTGGGKGSLSDFKNEANDWWSSTAGQKHAKDKNIKHRISSPSKQRFIGGVASSGRSNSKSFNKPPFNGKY